MAQSASPKPGLIVVGNGMVGHHFVREAVRLGLAERYRLTVFADEPRLAYDRVHLTQFFSDKSADDLKLVEPGEYENAGVEALVSDAVVELQLDQRRVRSAGGRERSYEWLVLATGSRPFVPEIPGRHLARCFVYRTIEDLLAIREAAAQSRRGVVIGGGLLGL